MSPEPIVANLAEALLRRLHPAITRWNRLEGRPRTHDFDRALQAEVRDALWMLSRQWQLGEFVGDDAGSPVLARACLDLRTLDRYQPGQGPVGALEADGVLEPIVEQRPPPLRLRTQALALDLRMAVGHRWMRLLRRDFPATTYADDYRDAYAVDSPDPTSAADAQVCAHEDVWQQVSCAAARAMDGVALLDHVADGGLVIDDVAVQPGDVAGVEELFERLRGWFAELVLAPATDDAWVPSRLEYAFAVAAPSGDSDAEGGTEIVLRAEEYDQGNLDWHALRRSSDVRLPDEQAPAPAAVAPVRDVQTFLPTQVVFGGMPNTRWWAFEDRRTNFGKVSADTTDLGTLMLMEFALVYANDWFVVPWTLPVGTLARVRGIAVTTVFDERLWVAPAEHVAGGGAWSMFRLSPDGDGDTEGDTDPVAELALLPVAAKVQEGAALEDVALVRDEVANMVWAIEQQVPLASGWSRPGSEAAHELRAYLQRLVGPPAGPPPAAAAPIRYQVMSQVPEQWLPFIPVHVDGSTRETQLQRAAMLRFLDGDPAPPVKVRPRTTLMSQNLPAAYYVFEEEVPRAGTQVSQCYQRTRRPDGAAVVWFGARRATGRGEGSSGLGFDRILHD